VDHESLVARLCELAEEAGRQLAADTECIAELRAELDAALEQLDRVRADRDRLLARCRQLAAVRAL
jgi:uncharacterized coiled-coil DUF342 family protein